MRGRCMSTHSRLSIGLTRKGGHWITWLAYIAISSYGRPKARVFAQFPVLFQAPTDTVDPSPVDLRPPCKPI